MFKKFSAFILAETSTITGSSIESKVLFCFFETRLHFVAQADLKLVATLLPQPPALYRENRSS